MRLLTDVDGDEVSPVKRAANRRRLVLKGDEMSEELEIADIMAVPWAHEGAMIDALRKSGIEDETVLKATVGAMRLLDGVSDELPDGMRESVAKLGVELYSRSNPPLNSGSAADVPGHNGQLTGSGSGAEMTTSGSASGADLDGHGRDGELMGRAKGKKVAADPQMDEEDDAEVCKAYEDMIAKRAFTSDQRQAMAGNGQAMAGGRYPIGNSEDIQNAIHAVGRGKGSHAAIRAHITARARALGATSMLPPTWVAKEDDTEKIDESLITRVVKALRRTQDARPSSSDDPDDDENNEPDDDPDDNNVKKGGTVETHAVPVQKEDGTWDLSAVPDESRPFYQAMIEKADETSVKLEKAEGELAETREALRTQEIIAKAEAEFDKVGAKDDVVEVLKAASDKLEPEAYAKLVDLLHGANEQIAKGDLFAELGKTHGGATVSGGDAWDKIEKAADDLVEKSDSVISKAQAIDRVLKTDTGAALYSAYMSETGMGV